MAEKPTPTELLSRLADGDRSVVDELLPLVYDELRRQAGGIMRGERPGHTLQPTALAHEAYLRLIRRRDVDWEGRRHFLALAAQAMRHLLVDHARAQRREKRGGDRRQVTLSEASSAHELDVELLDLHDALEELHERDERQARIVEMRYFGGLTVAEIASLLDVGTSTVDRDWATARAWLQVRLTS